MTNFMANFTGFSYGWSVDAGISATGGAFDRKIMRDPGGVGSRNLDPTSGYIDQLIVGSGRKEIVDFIPGLAIITTSGIDGDAVEGDILHRCIRGFHRQEQPR